MMKITNYITVPVYIVMYVMQWGLFREKLCYFLNCSGNRKVVSILKVVWFINEPQITWVIFSIAATIELTPHPIVLRSTASVHHFHDAMHCMHTHSMLPRPPLRRARNCVKCV